MFILITIFASAASANPRYKTESYCDGVGYVQKCKIGLYGRECEHTGQRCEDAQENMGCVDARVTLLPPCDAGMNRIFEQGSCNKKYQITSTFCAD